MNANTVITSEGRELMVLFEGRRGLRGRPGDKGDTGDPGRSIRTRGTWNAGNAYAPGDAVSADSSAAAGIRSLFVQRDGTATEASTTEPRDAPERWAEIGPTDLSNVTGAIWRVTQINHGFDQIGEPVGYSPSAERWVSANNRQNDEVAVALVRDIPSSTEIVLQSTGEIFDLDPSLILPSPPSGEQFEPGQLYYVAASRGRLTLEPTINDSAYASKPILLATGPTSGVVLPWQQTENRVDDRLVALDKFLFIATEGQTVLEGEDENGDDLEYQVGDQTEVFVNGLKLRRNADYAATNGTSITLADPLSEGDWVAVWTPSEPLTVIAPATSIKLDPIDDLFDGDRRVFPVTVDDGVIVGNQPTDNTLIWIDGNALEPRVDYEIDVDPDDINASIITFTEAPQLGQRFWGITGVPVGGNTQLAVVAEFPDAFEMPSPSETEVVTPNTGRNAYLVKFAGFGEPQIMELPVTFADTATFQQAITAQATLDVTGAAEFGGALIAQGAATFNDTATFAAPVSFEDMVEFLTATFGGAVEFSEPVTFGGTATFNDVVTVNADSHVAARLRANTLIVATDTLPAGRVARVNGAIDIDGTLHALSAVNVTGLLTANGQAAFNALATFNGDLDFEGSDVGATSATITANGALLRSTDAAEPLTIRRAVLEDTEIDEGTF